MHNTGTKMEKKLFNDSYDIEKKYNEKYNEKYSENEKLFWRK